MRQVTLAAVQFTCTADPEENVEKAEGLVREAAAGGAQIVCLPELFETEYFPVDDAGEPMHFGLARPREGHPTVARMGRLAAELGVVLPVSFFEKANTVYYNTVAIVDADGSVLGYYRKSHIPNDPGYDEKYYFSPGDTGFLTWRTQYATIGVGVCWDQWFPECARIMALRGAEVLLYPTANGDAPVHDDVDWKPHWQVTMQGHAGANMVPVVAANRVGSEHLGRHMQTYFGSSFIAGPEGQVLVEASANREDIVLATIDLDAAARKRSEMPFFRDRRPDLYGPLLTLDGGLGRAGEDEAHGDAGVGSAAAAGSGSGLDAPGGVPAGGAADARSDGEAAGGGDDAGRTAAR